MKLKKLLAILLMVTMCISALAGCGKDAENGESAGVTNANGEEETTTAKAKDVVLNFWYTDAAMTEYFTYAVEKYHAQHPNVTINLNVAASTGYLENINTQSIKQTNAVDVYMLAHFDLEQAYLGGLAYEYDPVESVINAENYGRSAIRAVTYGERQVAYPLYFDSAFLIYNKAYVTEVPKTFDDIKNFLNASDEDEQTDENSALSSVEKTFVWPVSDYTFNYAFLSDAFVMGGVNGDDRSQINVVNDTVMTALDYYHGLYDFYAINRDEVDYESCIEDFIAGKTAFTFAKTGMIPKLEESGVDYGTACMPDINETITGGSLSYTQTLVVNPYSLNIDVAQDFVKMVTCDYVDRFYEMTGFYPACNTWNYENDRIAGIYANYDDSTPRPKMMTLGGYYIELEILLHKIWDEDGDMAQLLTEFQDFVITQIQLN